MLSEKTWSDDVKRNVHKLRFRMVGERLYLKSCITFFHIVRGVMLELREQNQRTKPFNDHAADPVMNIYICIGRYIYTYVYTGMRSFTTTDDALTYIARNVPVLIRNEDHRFTVTTLTRSTQGHCLAGERAHGVCVYVWGK